MIAPVEQAEHTAHKIADRVAHRHGQAPHPQPQAAHSPAIGDRVMGGVGTAMGVAGGVQTLSFVGSLLDKPLKFMGKIPVLGLPFKGVKAAADFVNTKTMEEVGHGASTIAEKIGAGNVANTVRAVESNVTDALHKAATHTIAPMGKAASKIGAKNVGGFLKDLPNSFGKMSVSHAATVGFSAGQSALITYSTVKDFNANLKAMKGMYADLTGKNAEEMSTWQLVKGNVPAEMKEARSQFVKNFAPQLIANGVGVAVNTKFMVNPLAGGWAIAVMAFVPELAKGAAALMGSSGPTLAPTYMALAKAHHNGQQIGAQDYGAFLTAASKDVKASGGIENKLVQAMAVHYAERQVSPKEILGEIHSGKFNETALKFQAELKVKADAEKIEKLKHPEKAVIGKHTAREAARHNATQQHAAAVGA